MDFQTWQPLRVLAAAVLAITLAAAQSLTAQTAEHLVSPQDLQQAAQNATDTRQQNMETLRGFLSSAEAKKAMDSAHIDPQQVQSAVAGLNDREMAELAARATKAQNDFAAGMSNSVLLLVILAILVIVIVAIVH